MGYQRAIRLKGVVFLATLCYLCHLSLGRGVSAYNSFLNDEVESSPRGWLEQASVSNPDCVLSACKFGGSTVLKPNEWRAGDCHHNIPKYTTFNYLVHGNVSIYLFTKGAMFDFKRGGKISSLLPDRTGRPDVTNGTYSFSKAYSLDDDGIFFVVYNDRDEDVAITFQAAYIVNPVPSHQDLPCSNFTSRESCESTMNGDNTCVWCSNPCSCMSIVSAEDDCDSGWDARLLTGTINVPGFSFDAWGYFAVILGGVIVIFVVGLFVAEFSIGVYNFIQKRKQYRKKDSSDDYAPLLTN